jgi:hypothetical protein
VNIRCGQIAEVTSGLVQTSIETRGSLDETFLSAKHQSCMSQAVTIRALTGEFPREEAARRRNDPMLLAVHRSDARAFPLSSSMPEFPLKIPDQIIDFYAFVFCQGGFATLVLASSNFSLLSLSSNLRSFDRRTGDH